MNKADIAKIVDRVKRKEHELDIRLQATDSLSSLSQSLSSKVESKVANNKVAMLKEVCSTIGEKIESQSFSEITKALESQTKLLKDESGQEIVASVGKLIQEVSKLQDNNYFDQKEFDAVFSGGIRRIIDTLVSQEEIPTNTFYVRDNQGRIKTVREMFANYELVHEWKYSGGYLMNVKVHKNVIE